MFDKSNVPYSILDFIQSFEVDLLNVTLDLEMELDFEYVF